MRRTLGLMLALALWALPPGKSAQAEEIFLTQGQQQALDLVLQADGYISERLHTRFWNALPADIRVPGARRDAFLGNMARTLAAGARYQAELWRSAGLSLAAGRVTHSRAFAKAKAEAVAAARRQNDETAEYDAHLSLGLGFANRLLQAAADKKPVVMPGGMIEITPDRVTEILSGLDASLARLDILFDPKWSAPLKDHYDPQAGVRLRVPVPPVKEIHRRKSKTGKELTTITLSLRMEEQDFVFLTYTEFGGPWRDAGKGMETLAARALANAGVPAPRLRRETWTGRLSAVGTGTKTHATEDEPETVHASARTVHVPERRAVLTLTSFSPRSAARAEALRRDLEAGLRIVP